MVDLSEIQAAYYMVAATGVLVAAIYYVYNMSATRKTQELALKTQELMLKSQEQTLETRQAQLFMGIYQAQFSTEFLKHWNTVMSRSQENIEKLWSTISPANDEAFIYVTKYFEGAAVLVKKRLLDVDLVYELNPTWISSFWLKYEPVLRKYRELANFPQGGRNLEYIGELMLSEAKRRGEPMEPRYYATLQ